jgi:ATP-dependent DNA ligase
MDGIDAGGRGWTRSLPSGSEHLDEKDGPLVFAHACKMGLEGIVSKRRDSGRSPD